MSYFDNGGIIGKLLEYNTSETYANGNKKNSGIWNLQTVWATKGPASIFPAYTIHAWNPDGGANSSGIITDVVGGCPLRAVDGSTPIADWNGESSSNNVVLFADSSDLATYRELSFASITYWVLFRSGSASFHGMGTISTADIFATPDVGSWELRRNGAGGFEFKVRAGFTGSSTVSFSPGTDTWRMVTILLGSTQWKVFLDKRAASMDVSYLTQVKTNIERGLGFLMYAPTPASYTEGVGGNSGFRGRMSDIRIHNKILSNEEIDALFDAGRQTY